MYNIFRNIFTGIFFTLAVVVLFGTTEIQSASAASKKCELSWMAFHTNEMSSTLLLQKTSPAGYVELVIWPSQETEENCSGWMGEIRLSETSSTWNDSNIMIKKPFIFKFADPGTNNAPTRVRLKAGEKGCTYKENEPDCEINAQVISLEPGTNKKTSQMSTSEEEWASAIKNLITTNTVGSGKRWRLRYDCTTMECNQELLWEHLTPPTGNLTEKKRVTEFSHVPPPTSGCRVISAQFNPGTTPGRPFGAVDGSYSGKSPAAPDITIVTKDCVDKEIKVSLMQENITASNTVVPALDNKVFKIDSSEKLTLKMKAGEEGCTKTPAPSVPDCKYYILIIPEGSTTGDNRVYNSRNQVSGNLDYELGGWGIVSNSSILNNKWKIISCTGSPDCEKISEVGLENNDSLITPDPLCMDENGQAIEGCYQFYGGLAEIGSNFAENTDEKLNVFERFTAGQGIGGIINAIIAFATGIAGIIVIIRIFYLGFRYMGIRKESNPVKLDEVKSQILKALIGFVLLLTIYILLRTINPDLLNLTPRFDTASLNSVYEEYKKETGETVSFKDFTSYIEKEYIPALNNALPDESKGTKLLLTAQAQKEGFFGGSKPSKSYRTNNPGNIGNVDSGATKGFATLEDGIRAQRDLLKKIIEGREPNYPPGKVVTKPAVTYGSTTYPGFSFTYEGKLYQYLKIYATGARLNNSYLNLIIGAFKNQGVTITGETTLLAISQIN